MKLMVVFPSDRKRAYGKIASDVSAITPPIRAALYYQYAVNLGIEASFLDADGLNLDLSQTASCICRENPEVVLIVSENLNSGDPERMETVAALSKAVKIMAPRMKVAVEGTCATAVPNKVYFDTRCDIVIRGEAWNVLDALDNDGILLGDTIPAKDVPMTPWSVMSPYLYRAHHWHCFGDLDDRKPYAAIWTNMGCPHNCTFCNVNGMTFGKPFIRYRPIENIMDELEHLNNLGVCNIRILDSDFGCHQGRVRELCERIIAKRYTFNMWCYIRISDIPDRAHLGLMKRAGINWLGYGLEAGDSKGRTDLHKSIDQSRMDTVMEWTAAEDLSVCANYMFGVPGDTEGSMQATLDMAIKYNTHWVNMLPATAYPGTSLYADRVRLGLPVPETWSQFGKYTKDAFPVGTETVTPVRVREFRDYAWASYFDRKEYRQSLLEKYGANAVDYVKNILKIKMR